ICLHVFILQTSYSNMSVTRTRTPSRDQNQVKHEDSGSTGNVEKKILQKSKSHNNKMSNCNSSDIQRYTVAGKKPLQCDTCGKYFKCLSALNVHQRMHTGEKPYSCNTCGKRYSQMSVLKDHIRTHTGEKPHICQICGKGFGRGSNLKIHARIHTGEKPYVCKICGKRFGYTSVLKTHLKIHTRGHLGGYGSGGRAGFPALRRLAIGPPALAPSTACQSVLESEIELQIAVSSACGVVSVQPLRSVDERV
uniref:C2H2-type domain-containing protein n=1 Tax=Dicentrarchus labrax TaxID=13489 RepID=A0A8C4E1G3_DICLA